MSQYVAAVPAGDLIRPEIRSFFEQFYQQSDSPECLEQYADYFTDNAKLIMGSVESNGRAEIIKFRHGMWEKVAHRSHTPIQLYSFGAGSDDIMLFGTVAYVLKDGKKVTVEWGGRSHFTNDQGKLKMDFYQVYLDSAAMSRAK